MKVILFIASVLILSCTGKNLQEGEHLPEKTMQRLLIDVNLAESLSTVVRDSVYKPGSKNLDSLATYYQAIFDHYHITPEQFNKSLVWYKSNPDRLDSMYNKMIPTIADWQNKKK